MKQLEVDIQEEYDVEGGRGGGGSRGRGGTAEERKRISFALVGWIVPKWEEAYSHVRSLRIAVRCFRAISSRTSCWCCCWCMAHHSCFYVNNKLTIMIHISFSVVTGNQSQETTEGNWLRNKRGKEEGRRGQRQRQGIGWHAKGEKEAKGRTGKCRR